MRDGELCGFRCMEENEGELELVLYYGDDMPSKGREQFHELFERFLYQREVDVTQFPPACCPEGHTIERNTFIKRLRDNQKFVFCYDCDDKVKLPILQQEESSNISPWLQREEAIARLRSKYERHLTKIKGYRRNRAAPHTYLSYLPEQAKQAKELADDLSEAGVYLVKKPEDLKADDFAIILDTPAYGRAYQNALPELAKDMQMIQSRLESQKYISIACGDKAAEHNLQDCKTFDFSDETHYIVSLFNLVMKLYALPLNHKSFEPLRMDLHNDWESTLAGNEVMDTPSTFKIFISYSHRDEEFKDDFLTFIKPLERQGILEIWHDRKIEEGDEWRTEIEKAMIECDLALLFVSKSFLASGFINDEELPQLFQRRRDEGLRVVPILVRQCLWQDEPTLKEIQALPRDNKPIVSFSESNGERDEIWTAIAQEIRKRAMEK